MGRLGLRPHNVICPDMLIDSGLLWLLSWGGAKPLSQGKRSLREQNRRGRERRQKNEHGSTGKLNPGTLARQICSHNSE